MSKNIETALSIPDRAKIVAALTLVFSSGVMADGMTSAEAQAKFGCDDLPQCAAKNLINGVNYFKNSASYEDLVHGAGSAIKNCWDPDGKNMNDVNVILQTLIPRVSSSDVINKNSGQTLGARAADHCPAADTLFKSHTTAGL